MVLSTLQAALEICGAITIPVPKNGSLAKKAVSDWFNYNSLTHDVYLSVSLDDPAFSLPGTAVVVAVGVEFSLSASNGQPFALPHNGTMGIVSCFNQ